MSTPVARARKDDPVLAAVNAAPVVEADDGEAAAFAEGLADIKAGRTVSAEDVRAQLKNQADE
jgi:predicted transcriptional regulator